MSAAAAAAANASDLAEVKGGDDKDSCQVCRKSSDDILPKAFLQYLNDSWTAFHAVAECKKQLQAAGFHEISERDTWYDVVKPNGRYFYTRNGSAIVAFAVGGQYKPGNGFIVVGGHTDSPCLKLKPKSKREKTGYTQIGCQFYGGGLWSTWFDRDLSVAGRCLVRRGDRVTHELVKIPKPICRVPMLAVHLARGSGTKVEINKEEHLSAILSTRVFDQVNAAKSSSEKEGGGEGKDKEKEKDKAAPIAGSMEDNHCPELLHLVAEHLGCAPQDILDFELQLCDTQPSAMGGVHDEFIYSGRLDNLCSVFCGTRALIDTSGAGDAAAEASLESDSVVRLFAGFDHEEIGSSSAPGAAGTLMPDALKRIANALAWKVGACSALLCSDLICSAPTYSPVLTFSLL